MSAAGRTPGRPKPARDPKGHEGAPRGPWGSSDVPVGGGADITTGCSGGEVFALRVIGNSMEPEFHDGEIIVIEPDGLAVEGSYVLARHGDEWIFRQLAKDGAQWLLRPLNAAWPAVPIADLSAVHGVVIQKAVPGRRRLTKHYV